MTVLTKRKAWKQLMKHRIAMESVTMRELFSQNEERFNQFSLTAPSVFLDYSKNRITEETLSLLIALAEEVQLREKIEAQFSGQAINLTEHRSVLHTALRNSTDRSIYAAETNVLEPIRAILAKVREFSIAVREGAWKGYTGKSITDVVNIGIGGSDLGPKMVCTALQAYAKPNLHTHFVSNVDDAAITETLKSLNPETTLFIVASKTFTTIETLTNAETARDWLLKQLKDPAAVAKHFVALSTNAEKVKAFGIDVNNMFEFWDWVGGRYSVWSAIGLSIAILIGMDQFEQFLLGAHRMDQHFRRAPFKTNMPVLLALLGVWYRNFFNAGSYAVIPYNCYLQYFSAYLQQLDMESNGKSITLQGEAVNYPTGPVIFGGTGTDSQHSFHQLLHQGTDMIPVDFIIAANSLNPVGNHQALLFSNCLAQAEALMKGKTDDEAYRELIEKHMPEQEARELAKHKVMPGNRPSNVLTIKKLTPEVLGSLIALYEQKVFVQGVIWGVNSFDQWGVELGKQLATKIEPFLLDEQKKIDADSSTAGLIELYHRWRG